MRLRTQLITGTLLFTFLLTVVLSLLFLSELLRERVAQTGSENAVLTQEILATTRSALQHGLLETPPTAPGPAAFNLAVQGALQGSRELNDVLNGLVRYSPDIQDASVTSAEGNVLVSTDPALVGGTLPARKSFATAGGKSLLSKRKLLFGAPEALDISLPLERNGRPFLAAHIGIRSTFLRNAYAPWLREAALVCIFALGGSLVLAAGLAAAALRPIEQIGRELEVISARGKEPSSTLEFSGDAVQRVSSTISRIDEQIRSSEQNRSEMAMNLNSMLQTLTDGVMLFTADLRVAMVNDAVAHFLPPEIPARPGAALAEVFPPYTAIGVLLPDWLRQRRNVRDETVTLQDGRTIQLSLDCFPGSGMGALLTLHDLAAREELEREIEVSRRMASIGRLTAGVGHEVKNPINAMVVHLELLRGKLGNGADQQGAQRHVEVLASEMSRLDRVVQTLADFSRPLEPALHEQELFPIVQAVVQLIGGEAATHSVSIVATQDTGAPPVRVLCDAELLRQALLNIALNAMQAMPDGGLLRMHLSRERQAACLVVQDNGVGIPSDKLNRIFDLYFTTKSSGSGIGLAMTYRIVQLHGGVIDVKSKPEEDSPDHGTTFTLRLPLALRSTAPTFAAVSA